MLATEISPELVPGEGDKPGQRTEDSIGPYSLQDFNLFYVTRYGLAAEQGRLSLPGMPGATRKRAPGRRASEDDDKRDL